MKSKRRRFSADFKAKVAMEAVRGRNSVNELASKYEVHPTQISGWKKHLQEGASGLFLENGNKKREEELQLRSRLYEQIGRLQVELDWLKKSVRE